MTVRALIVGATSTVGKYVVDQLAAGGLVEPIAGVRKPEQARMFAEQGVATVDLDLDSAASVKAAVTGIDRIFLLTGYTVAMLPQSKLVIDYGKAAGATHIVHMGAWAPDDTDLPHFGWHQYVERYIEGSGLGWTHVAPHMFMQNMLGQGNLWKAFTDASEGDRGHAGSRPIHSPIGDGRVGWVAAEDIARVCVAALEDPSCHAGRKYDLSVDVKTVPEVVTLLEETLGRPFHAVMHSPEAFGEALLAGGMEPTYAACATENAGRFARDEVPGQDNVFPFEEIVGVPPVLWPAFIEAHRDAFIGH
ncbi:NmrA family NAD(P)-binding protein [Sphingomonas hankookensis]